MSDWLTNLLAGQQGADAELVQRYSHRLMEFARRQLPERIRRRVDPEDVVQSVYRSFFRRLNEGRFTLDDSQDVWRLLAAITFHKARNAVKFHQRDRRDARRDQPLPLSADSPALCDVAEPQPGSDDVEVLFDSLERLLTGLPENYRSIVVRRLEGESIQQTAQAVQRSQRTVLRVLAHLQELAARQLESSP